MQVELNENLFLANYLKNLDPNEFANSIDHLELLTTNLNFFYKFLGQKNLNCDLRSFLEQLFEMLLEKKKLVELNRIEINYIHIFCKLLGKFDNNATICSLVLKKNQLNLELKIEIVQCLCVEKLIDNSNCLPYINFIFTSMDSLFENIFRSNYTQKTTKLVNNIIWIIFYFMENDLYVNQSIEGIEGFIDKILFEPVTKDNQLVDFILDFIASLINFCASKKKLLNEQIEKKAEPKFLKKFDYIQQIKSNLKNEKINEIVVNSTLNLASTSIRKKGRYIINQLSLLPSVAVEILEVLEEKQIHLIKPFIDKKLISFSLKIKISIQQFQTVLELLVFRMLNHNCRHVKLYAFKFIQDQYTSSGFEFISEKFILDQVILTLQDNLIYDENFMKESMNYLSSISTDKILKSLLDKESLLSSYGLYFILKQVFSNSSHQKISHIFDTFTVQKLLNLPNLIGERSIRASVQIYLIRILIRNLGNNEIEFFLNILFCLKVNEIQIQNVISDVDQIIEFDKLDLNNNCQLIGLARYYAIIYEKSFELNQFDDLLKQLHSMNTSYLNKFLVDFLNVITKIDITLWNRVKKIMNVFENFEILKIFCSKMNDEKIRNEIFYYLIEKINFEIETENRIQYLGLLSDLNIESEAIENLFSNLLLRLDIVDETHWKLLNKYLNNKSKLNVDHIFNFFFDQPILSYESKLDFLSNLILKIPTKINIHLIEFFGYLLNNELKNEISIEKTLILKNIFMFDNFLFKCCVDTKKFPIYKKMFKLFIERFAFPGCLFYSKNSMSFLNDSHNFSQLDNLFEKIYNLNSLEIKSILLDHINKLICDDLLLLENKLFSTFLINSLEKGCLFDKKFLVLTDHLKKEILNDEFLKKCLNFDSNFDFHKETRIKAISISLKLNFDILKNLMDKLIEKEIEIQNLKTQIFPNSTIHRTQVKIWQFILLVTLKASKLMNKDDIDDSYRIYEILKIIYDLTIKSIIKQNLTQPSVGILQQIIIIILIKNYPDKFYEQFKDLLSVESTSDYLSNVSRNKDNEVNKIGYITSLLSIMFHLIKLKPELKYYPINYLITCNHYKTRLLSHLVLIENNVQINLLTNQFEEIKAIPKSISGSNNIIKNLNLLREDWFFSLFDYNHDINLYFIFYLLPKLTNFFEDDFIDLYLLRKHFDGNLIKLQNTKSKLNDATYTNHNRSSRNINFEECLDNQKKIFQKKYIGPQLDINIENANKKFGKLIICASLIDRLPNLGGLARTSEIFGVRKLIIPSNKILKEKEFLNLSVTAEKWINIEECFPWNLVNYLRDLKRNHNYTLIGIEQSTESICLTKFQFPTKSLILLGNEKEGLPVELLSMMDYCVEIPQSGYIKSLNVHITGALCAFEYFKQQSFQQSFID